MSIGTDNTFRLEDIIKILWLRKKLILICTSISLLIGVLIGYLSPEVYRAQITFLVQSGDDNGLSKLGGLASIAGINTNGLGNQKGITLSVYPKLLESIPFGKQMIRSKINFEGDSIVLKDYLLSKKPSGLSMLKKYTLGLPKTIISAIKTSGRTSNLEAVKEGTEILSSIEYALVMNIPNMFSLTVDEYQSLVILTGEDTDPHVAKQITQLGQNVLQDLIINYQIQNSQRVFDFIDSQWEIKRKEFYKIQNELAKYSERNLNVTAASAKIEEERFRSELNVVGSVYSELSVQRQQAAIQIEENTPIFSIIDPVITPAFPSSPKKLVLFLIFGILGLIFSIGIALAYDPFLKIKGVLKNN